MEKQELFIVELLTRPDGPSYKRSLPKLKEDANRLAASLGVAGVLTRVVPAEKYAFKGQQQKVERPEEATPKGGFRSKVE